MYCRCIRIRIRIRTEAEVLKSEVDRSVGVRSLKYVRRSSSSSMYM